MRITKARQLLGRFKKKRIVVVGDLILDRYVTGTVGRISPEAPVPVVNVEGERALPGGAANVALNIQKLGGNAAIVGVAGSDDEGRELVSILNTEGINTDGVMHSELVRTSVKTRVMAERQQIVRVDRENTPAHVSGALRAFSRRLEGAIGNDADAVIIDDYGKGVITQGVINTIMRICKKKRVPVGFDPKYNRKLHVKGLTLATPNLKEALFNAGLEEFSLVGDLAKNRVLKKAGRALSSKWGVQMLMITLGGQGLYLLPKKGAPTVIPALAREVFDVSGAGDTVIASSMLALASGGSFKEAAELANVVAGIVVGKVGTAVCTPAEILESIS
jgi:D-beta-D-heptose 7-phosphate kinase/D-beta-D-heptose 1-phosphate adenosyltransferase